jgi:hypothetical protein
MALHQGGAELDGLIIVGGITLLVILAVAIGLAMVDETSRSRAWRRIADARRRNWEEARETQALLDTLERCKRCPFRR